MLNRQYNQSLRNAKEYLNPVKLGKIPTNLKGIYIQNGPGEFNRWGTQTHPFDGDGYIRKIEFKEGNAYFQGRYVDTWQRKLENFCNVRLFTGAFGSAPKFCLLKNPVNTNAILLDENRIAASSEMGRTYLLDVNTLKTIGLHSQDISAHTHEGVSVKRNYLGNESTQLIFTENNIDSTIYIPNFIYFHDFAVTNDYYLFFDHCLSMNLLNGYRYGWVNGLSSLNQPTVLYLVHKTTHLIQKITIPEVVGFSYHFLCSCQTKNSIELFYTLYPAFFSLPSEDFPGKIYKTTLYLCNFSQKTECIQNEWFEFPKYDKITKECFGIFPKKSSLGLYNINTNNIFYTDEPGKIWNEPFFDSNYLMSLVFDIDKNKTDLYIFDRSKLFRDPIIIPLPSDIPMGFHGNFSV